jgi:hypothetical protein
MIAVDKHWFKQFVVGCLASVSPSFERQLDSSHSAFHAVESSQSVVYQFEIWSQIWQSNA